MAKLTQTGKIRKSVHQWTDEHDAYIREAYPANVPLRDMYIALKAMGGLPKLTHAAITSRAFVTLLRRTNSN